MHSVPGSPLGFSGVATGGEPASPVCFGGIGFPIAISSETVTNLNPFFCS